MTHTPTPWQTGGWSHDDDAAVVHAGGAKFAQALYLGGTDQAKANADRIVACANFFHGKDIPTERIAEGGIGELLWFVEYTAHQRCECNDSTCPSCKACDLLAKLGVEE